MSAWRYENYGLVSDAPPHITPDIAVLDNNWKTITPNGIKIKPLYIKWTDCFDCGYETEWWYLIKDDTFDINQLKAKRRYEINKGNKHFISKEIDPKDYLKEINSIRSKLFAQYPNEYKKKNDINMTNELYLKTQNNKDWITIGAISRDTNLLCGYADINIKEGYLDFVRMCVDPSCEKEGINFSLVNGVMEASKPYIIKGYYICDGQRSIRHKTAFQEWLVKYFNFRYSYCHLHVRYSKIGKLLLLIGKKFKKTLENSNSSILYKLLVFVKMGEIAESFEDNQQG